MPIIATDPELPPRPVRPAAITPEVVVAGQGAQTAIVRFNADPAGLKNAALSLLDKKVSVVESVEQASDLADRIAQARTLIKNIDARRKQIVEPIKKEAAAVDAEARLWSDPVQAWMARAETVLLAYRRKQADDARRQEEARQAALRDAAQKQHQAEILAKPEAVEAASTEIMRREAEAPAQEIKAFRTESGTASVRLRWKVEVVNPEEVPDAYMVPDLKKLQAAVDAGARQIDGCNIFEDESLVVRTR